tara:strand:- start:24042 stop:24281 length:240 start_codon:yes stop_codon:yes gene_type:complete
MEIFFIAFGVMLLLVLIMSVGVILGKKPISGSCGGMSALGMEVACDVCKGDKSKCDKENEEISASDLSYDASSNDTPSK